MANDEIRESARSLGAEAFAQRHPYPVLVVIRDHTTDATREFRTRDISALDLDGGLPAAERTEVFPVRRVGSESTSMVTIGRASNMDIVLDSPSVSKLHAYFQLNLDGDRWTFADAGSRNGTLLNGRLMPGKEPQPVISGDIIVFAKIFRAEFLEPAEAYRRFSTS